MSPLEKSLKITIFGPKIDLFCRKNGPGAQEIYLWAAALAADPLRSFLNHISWMNLVDEYRGWISWIQISWISWMNLVDESRGFRSRESRGSISWMNLVNLVDESRGWISWILISWMDLVDPNLVNLVDCPWGLRLQIRSLSLGFASPKSVLVLGVCVSKIGPGVPKIDNPLAF